MSNWHQCQHCLSVTPCCVMSCANTVDRFITLSAAGPVNVLTCFKQPNFIHLLMCSFSYKPQSHGKLLKPWSSKPCSTGEFSSSEDKSSTCKWSQGSAQTCGNTVHVPVFIVAAPDFHSYGVTVYSLTMLSPCRSLLTGSRIYCQNTPKMRSSPGSLFENALSEIGNPNPLAQAIINRLHCLLQSFETHQLNQSI